MEKNYSYSVGALALVGSILSLCIGTSFAKTLFADLGPQGTTSYRLLFSAILLWLLWRPWRFTFSRHYLLPLLYCGVSLGLLNFLFYMALQTIPLGIALAIEFCGPLGLALFSSRRKNDFIWIGLVVLGLFFIIPFEVEQRLDPIGVMYAILAAIFWGSYIITGQKIRFIHPGQASTLGVTIAALVVLPFALLNPSNALWQPNLFPLGLLVGVLSSAIPYSLEMISLRSLDRKSFGVLLSLEPAFGTIAAAIILQEFLSVQQMVAIACIMMASIGCTLSAQRKNT